MSLASSVTVIGAPVVFSMLELRELKLVDLAERRLGQGELDEGAADRGVDGEQVVRAARLSQESSPSEAGEGRSRRRRWKAEAWRGRAQRRKRARGAGE